MLSNYLSISAEADLGLLQHLRWSTIITKSSILDGAAVLDPPLISADYLSINTCLEPRRCHCW